MKKLLPKRKPERKPSDEEFALRKSESVRRVDEDTVRCISHRPGAHWGESWLAALRRLQAEVGAEP